MEDLVTGRVDVRARAACLWEIKAADSSAVRAALDHSLEPNGGYLDDCVMAEEKCNDWAKDPVSVAVLAHASLEARYRFAKSQVLVHRIVPWTRDLLGSRE